MTDKFSAQSLDDNELTRQLLGLAADHALPANASSAMVVMRIMRRLLTHCSAGEPVVLGLSGAQGSGKSTLSALLELGMARIAGRRVAVLSLDDFYLPHADRQVLARTIHPLCATRGVPGTHDIALLLATLDQLATAGADTQTRWPRFNKLSDDRAPAEQATLYIGRADLVVVEGWCVGLPAHRLPAWTGPINALEAEADPDGLWQAWSRAQLATHYAALWARLDLLVGLRLPDIATVVASRLLQEQRMQAAQLGRHGPNEQGMNEAAIWRFVQHYERMTLALWDALPELADLLFERTAGFDYRAVPCRGATTP